MFGPIHNDNDYDNHYDGQKVVDQISDHRPALNEMTPDITSPKYFLNLRSHLLMHLFNFIHLTL